MSDEPYAWRAYVSPAKEAVRRFQTAILSVMLEDGIGLGLRMSTFTPRLPRAPGAFDYNIKYQLSLGEFDLGGLEVNLQGAMDDDGRPVVLSLHAEASFSVRSAATPSQRDQVTGAMVTLVYCLNRLSTQADQANKAWNQVAPAAGSNFQSSAPAQEVLDDLRTALQNLGYRGSEIQTRIDQAVAAVTSTGVSPDLNNLISAALKKQHSTQE